MGYMTENQCFGNSFDKKVAVQMVTMQKFGVQTPQIFVNSHEQTIPNPGLVIRSSGFGQPDSQLHWAGPNASIRRSYERRQLIQMLTFFPIVSSCSKIPEHCRQISLGIGVSIALGVA